jgi:hypothetical protein
MFRVGDKVKCVAGHADSRILKTDEVYEVAVIVEKGFDHIGECSGIIVINAGRYPYVWDENRFVAARLNS